MHSNLGKESAKGKAEGPCHPNVRLSSSGCTVKFCLLRYTAKGRFPGLTLQLLGERKGKRQTSSRGWKRQSGGSPLTQEKTSLTLQTKKKIFGGGKTSAGPKASIKIGALGGKKDIAVLIRGVRISFPIYKRFLPGLKGYVVC